MSPANAEERRRAAGLPRCRTCPTRDSARAEIDRAAGLHRRGARRLRDRQHRRRETRSTSLERRRQRGRAPTNDRGPGAGSETRLGMASVRAPGAFALRFGDINPLDLVQRQRRVAAAAAARRRRAGGGAGAVPRVRQRPVPGDDRRPDRVLVDALHDHRPLPERPAGRHGDGLGGSGLDRQFNYVRNSVKATVDAYDGDITFYVIDESDPMVRACAKAFPELFSDDEPPQELPEHFRYPEDLFRVQTNMWGRYHMTDPRQLLQRTSTGGRRPRTPGRRRRHRRPRPRSRRLATGGVRASRRGSSRTTC